MRLDLSVTEGRRVSPERPDLTVTERLAGLLFVPYAAWVTYATILNASLWLLNET